MRGGVQQHQVGVLSLYRQQIKLLSYLLEEWKDIDILTADRSQGRDKDCIIISMVRSNDLGQASIFPTIRISLNLPSTCRSEISSRIGGE